MKTAQPQLTQIVRAELDNAFSLAALQLQANREQGRSGEQGYLDRFADAWLRTQERRPAWLALSLDGRPLGCVILYVVEGLPRPGRTPRPRVLLTDAYVVKDVRRTGLGDRLVKTALSWCHGRQAVWVQVDRAAIADTYGFWRKAGFTAAADGAYQFRGIDGPQP
ncbi:MAG: GNAT family N-acetyltransferase [Austwickia sp.]|nr:GNAT family N-acetyltransferase [Austwickia sp.]MBK8435206.1 GNAT family N-acetyltransferase [Austwickia sp.]MBK9101241.1 GNAT family N-acetyltransferase [Austwickia sp.]